MKENGGVYDNRLFLWRRAMLNKKQKKLFGDYSPHINRCESFCAFAPTLTPTLLT